MLKEKMRKFVTTRKEVYKEKTKTSNRDIKKFVLINKKLYIKITIETIKVITLSLKKSSSWILLKTS
jgi:hypothetical protein